ncbi:hypothetical protein GH5_05635 [Leishmania sp. Ghana 2012 LV757]|uniref:hypothetical protein n=1 Tax=Leishmania sp. Ghana 2012 LV757 TaxID=2803181 RepID=UPI001B7B29FB|nr:hypothetical protein GH5_05635 [Leishmania sp. Ghana 2012 LV757]
MTPTAPLPPPSRCRPDASLRPGGSSSAGNEPNGKRRHRRQQRQLNGSAQDGTHRTSTSGDASNHESRDPVGVDQGRLAARLWQRRRAGACRWASLGFGRVGSIVVPTSKGVGDVAPRVQRLAVCAPQWTHLLQSCLELRNLKKLGATSLIPGNHKSFQYFSKYTNDFELAAVPCILQSCTTIEDTSITVGGQLYTISEGGGSIVLTIGQQQQRHMNACSFVGKFSQRGEGMEIVMLSEGS